MTTVLFACVHNAGRSQMAAAFFNSLADRERARAISAGTRPASRVHPEVAQAMAAAGVDISASVPILLDQALAERVDLLVTMGCGEACPVVPGLRRLDWSVADPKGQAPERVQAIRDEIRALVEGLVEAEGWAHSRAG